MKLGGPPICLTTIRTYLDIFIFHLNPLIQIILMNPKAQEKAVLLPNLKISMWYWVRIRENITNVTQRKSTMIAFNL